jgi:hypothetical protein
MFFRVGGALPFFSRGVGVMLADDLLRAALWQTEQKRNYVKGNHTGNGGRDDPLRNVTMCRFGHFRATFPDMTTNWYPPGTEVNPLRALTAVGRPRPGEESINLSGARPGVQSAAATPRWPHRGGKETWLRTNRRALMFGAVPPFMLAVLGAWLAFGVADAAGGWMVWTAIAMVAVGVVLVAALLSQVGQPRIAYRDGHVLFYLRSGAPLAVPVSLVEAFFLGQGPLLLTDDRQQRSPTVNLVARLSQRAPEWSQRDVKPALGRWCESYVTIRGAWCEPLTEAVVRQLNRRLREVTDAIATKEQK